MASSLPSQVGRLGDPFRDKGVPKLTNTNERINNGSQKAAEGTSHAGRREAPFAAK